MNDQRSAVIRQVHYIAKLMVQPPEPRNENRVTLAREAIIEAAESGDMELVVEALSNNRSLYWAKTPSGRRGVMTREIRMLADNLLAKIERLGLRSTKKRKVAA